MKALESNVLIFLVHLTRNVFNLSSNSVQSKEIFVSSEVVCFSSSELFQKGICLEWGLELFGTHLLQLRYILNFKDILIKLQDGSLVLLTDLSSVMSAHLSGNFNDCLITTEGGIGSGELS